jgi:hypothetical protein
LISTRALKLPYFSPENTGFTVFLPEIPLGMITPRKWSNELLKGSEGRRKRNGLNWG